VGICLPLATHLPSLFADFNDNSVLLHGNLSLRSLLKDPRSDQLLAMINPGTLLWGPREFELFRLWEKGMSEQLLFRYLQRAPVSESFLTRRGLYLLLRALQSYTDTECHWHSVFYSATFIDLPPRNRRAILSS